MFRLSPLLTGHHAGRDAAVVILVTMLFRRTVTQSYRRIRVAIARINAYLQEHVTGIVVLQLFNRERKSARGIRRDQSPAHGGVQGRHHGVWLVLSGGGIHLA